MLQRSSGVLLHLTSLPGPYGIGDLGPVAHSWVDWLSDTGSKYWQVLPLGPTDHVDSPYSSVSSRAGNLNLISPDLLVRDGLLAPDDLVANTHDDRADYASVAVEKKALIDLAFKELAGALEDEFTQFTEAEADWLGPYALFMAIKDACGGDSWTDWPTGLRTKDQISLRAASNELAEEVARYEFGQFLFYRQLAALREHAASRGIEIIGDVPLYVAGDSLDVWLQPELFAVNPNTGRPTLVAGVPPDMFSATGQLWGNPLYNWDAHSSNGFAWWEERLRGFLRQADVLRIDHFTGLVRYYEIDGESTSAEDGVWRDGPGRAFFAELESRLGELPLILEDLGPLGQVVEDLRQQLGYPGMKILQEAFDGDADNPFLPENFTEDCVVYTGTHDNDTALGRLRSESDEYRRQALSYTDSTSDDFSWRLISTAWESKAVLAVAPMQDLLGLGTEARMNRPATIDSNWQWRMQSDEASSELAEKLLRLNRRTGRTT